MRLKPLCKANLKVQTEQRCLNVGGIRWGGSGGSFAASELAHLSLCRENQTRCCRVQK